MPTRGDIGQIASNERLPALIDYLVVLRHAAEEVAGEARSETLRALARFGARIVAVTLGAERALY